MAIWTRAATQVEVQFASQRFGPRGQVISAAEATGKTVEFITKNWTAKSACRLYDSHLFPAGDALEQSLNFFSVPIGAQSGYTGRTRNIGDTNMERGGQLPPPRCMVLERIVLSFSGRARDEDVFDVAENYVLRFRLDDRIFAHSPIISMRPFDHARAPVRICSYCRGVYVGIGCNGCGAREATLLTINGEPETFGKQFLYEVVPLYIAPLQQFGVELIHVYANVRLQGGVRMWVNLEGVEHGVFS